MLQGGIAFFRIWIEQSSIPLAFLLAAAVKKLASSVNTGKYHQRYSLDIIQTTELNYEN